MLARPWSSREGSGEVGDGDKGGGGCEPDGLRQQREVLAPREARDRDVPAARLIRPQAEQRGGGLDGERAALAPGDVDGEVREEAGGRRAGGGVRQRLPDLQVTQIQLDLCTIVLAVAQVHYSYLTS